LECVRVNLTDVNRFRLQELLEHHPIVRMFASGDSYAVWFERLTNCGVAYKKNKAIQTQNGNTDSKRKFGYLGYHLVQLALR
jgi:hypothetical protein